MRAAYAIPKRRSEVLKDDVRVGFRHGAEPVLDVMSQYTVLNSKVRRRSVRQVRYNQTVYAGVR